MKNSITVLSALQFKTWEITRIKCLISPQNSYQEWCEQLLPSWRNTCAVEWVSSHCLSSLPCSFLNLPPLPAFDPLELPCPEAPRGVVAFVWGLCPSPFLSICILCLSPFPRFWDKLASRFLWLHILGLLFACLAVSSVTADVRFGFSVSTGTVCFFNCTLVLASVLFPLCVL